MPSRLHSVFTLLLALLVLGAGSQAAICDLACGLGSRVQCHGAATASTEQALTGMPEMHCSGMESSRASKPFASSVQFESGEMGLCRHSSPLATVSTDSGSESSAAVHWVIVEPVAMQLSISDDRFVANSNAPPLYSAAHPLLVTLRV